MVSAKLFFGFILILYLIGCTLVHDNSQNLNRLKNLSEKTGIEMIVIDEAEKITKSNASRFLRRMMGSAYVEDPIQSSIRQDFPKNKTVELPGVSFIVNKSNVEELVDSLNKKFAYRNCLAFISDDRSNEENKHTISIIHATDKYNILRHQETTGGSYLFSTDSLITKLKAFEHKYPFKFIGVGDDWLRLKTIGKPNDWTDFAKEILKVCPNDESNLNDSIKALQNDNGKVFMWWD